MGRTALYRDIEPWLPPRAEVQLDADTVFLRMTDGRVRRHVLHGCEPSVVDGCYVSRDERRFVRMLVVDETVIITPPDRGAVAPFVVRVPEAPSDAWIVEQHAWDVLAEWLLVGGRLGAYTLGELARLSTIASAQFAS